jgi:RNA polymerase sigma-54 factor
MKQQLIIGQRHQLTMTPQLQQAIRLLKLSTLELEVAIRQAVETNPMLELVEDDDENAEAEENDEGLGDDIEAALEADEPAEEEGSEDGDTDLEDSEVDFETHAEAATDVMEDAYPDEDEVGATDAEWQEEIPDDLTVDSNWDDVYPTVSTAAQSTEDDFDIDSGNSAQETLQDHLEWQLNLAPITARDRAIALAIIDAIDDDGMLTLPIEEIASGFDAEDEVELDEVEAVLHLVQQFDPPGVAARDLRECLLIQLRQYGENEPCVGEAISLVENHLGLLASHDFNQLMRRTRLDRDTLSEVVKLIQTTNPRPGSAVDSTGTDYIIPDVIVRKQKGRWMVELNPDAAPRVRLNPQYAGFVQRGNRNADNTFLRNNLQEARQFLNSLQARNETLLKVATRIVERQQAFFEHGPEAMRPLVLKDIAEAVDMHESPISRVTSQKYMHTPRGIFELKYFFSSRVDDTSATAIQALIKKLIADEDPKRPLSDSKLEQLIMKTTAKKVARRTIAKYREALRIPPSNERKRIVY